MKLKLKIEEVEKMESIVDSTQSIHKTNQLENDALRERVDMMRNEINKLQLTKSEREQFLSKKLTEKEIELKEFNEIIDKLDKIVSELVDQDEEWSNMYVNQIMKVKGPKKLTFITQILKRLEGKIREVTILRKTLKEVKSQEVQSMKDRDLALELLSNKNGGYQAYANMVLDKQSELKEQIDQKLRMREDYDIMLKEKSHLQTVNFQPFFKHDGSISANMRWKLMLIIARRTIISSRR